jgi:hypothetical protein
MMYFIELATRFFRRLADSCQPSAFSKDNKFGSAGFQAVLYVAAGFSLRIQPVLRFNLGTR